MLRTLAALETVSLGVRPEKVGQFRSAVMSSEDGPAACGLQLFEKLGKQATFGDAKSTFLAGCQETYSKSECGFAAAELWQGRDLSSEMTLDVGSDFCQTLRWVAAASKRSALLEHYDAHASLEKAVSAKLRKRLTEGSDGAGADTEPEVTLKRAFQSNMPPLAPGVPDTDMPPASGGPVHLFWQGGQSECVGQASGFQLNRDDSGMFDDYKGTPDNIWLASTVGSQLDNFFIAKLHPQVAGSMFGVELGFSRRYHEVTGARVLIVKYCIGGTTVQEHWNPDLPGNTWNYSADDGSARWLALNAGITWSKEDLFKTNVFHTRRTIEALEAANVPYEWKGIIWIQGLGDTKTEDGTTAEKFGEDTARLFDAIRDRAIGIPDLPIIDRGAGANPMLNTGKAIAGQLVKGCNVVHVEEASVAVDPDVICTPQQIEDNSCPNMFTNIEFYNLFGWDEQVPDSELPAGANSKKFPWWKEWPRNMHSEYGGMVLQSVSMANAFIQEFTSFRLTRAMRFSDPALRYPYTACSDGQWPSNETFCWPDERDLDERAACVPTV